MTWNVEKHFIRTNILKLILIHYQAKNSLRLFLRIFANQCNINYRKDIG